MTPQSKSRYALLSNSVDSDDQISESQAKGRQSRLVKSAIRPTFLTCLAVFTVTLVILVLRIWSYGNEIVQCGTTTEEARSRGCLFETTSFAWLPKQCTDPEVDEEFLSIRKVKFYRDVNYTQLVPIEEVTKGNGPGFFVTHDYHTSHCALLLKKLHRAYHRGGKVDGLITSLHHTSHCVKMLLDPPEDVWTHPAFAYTKFPYCGREGGYNVEWEKQGEWTE